MIGPDYAMRVTAHDFEKNFGRSYCGPGIYKGAEDTLLVTCVDPEGNWKVADNPWLVPEHWPRGTLLNVHVWNQTWAKTILPWMACAPVRSEP